MIKSLFLALTISTSSYAATKVPTFFCKSDAPRGAIYLELDEVKQKSVGRISHPYTKNLDDLKKQNLPQSEYTKLFVTNVELFRTDIGRPYCPECYIFNAGVYLPSQDPQVIEATKSWISRVMLKDGTVALQLKHYIGDDQYLVMTCEKL